MLLADLERMTDTIYKDKLRDKIDKMLGTWTVDMSPRRYRRLYRDKTYKQEFNLGHAAGNHTSSTIDDVMKRSMEVSPTRRLDSFVSKDPIDPSGKVANQGNLLSTEAKLAKEYHQHDIVGLSIINASNAKYKAKFNAVRKHL